MSEEQVESSEVVEQAEETTNESAEPKAVEAKSAAVTKPVPPEIKAKQDAEKAKSKAQPKSVLAKAGDPRKPRMERNPKDQLMKRLSLRSTNSHCLKARLSMRSLCPCLRKR